MSITNAPLSFHQKATAATTSGTCNEITRRITMEARKTSLIERIGNGPDKKINYTSYFTERGRQ